MNSLPQFATVAFAKCLIDTQDAAIEQGRWDAENGQPCNPDAYAYPNDARRSHLRGDYVYSYMLAKGL